MLLFEVNTLSHSNNKSEFSSIVFELKRDKGGKDTAHKSLAEEVFGEGAEVIVLREYPLSTSR